MLLQMLSPMLLAIRLPPMSLLMLLLPTTVCSILSPLPVKACCSCSCSKYV